MKTSRRKVRSLSEALRITRRAKAAGKKVVTTNGCFDILHVGHIRYLEKAKSLGDILIVGVNSDRSVRRNKGKGRPIVPSRERAEVIASLKPVDAVFIFNDTIPNSWLAKLKPHIHVKGIDRKMSEIVEKNVVEKHGGRIVLTPLAKGKSTTNVIEKILKAHLK